MPEIPISVLFKVLGAVIVIAIIAFLFMVVSNFSLAFVSDGNAVARFEGFARGMQIACKNGAHTKSYFEFSSSDSRREYAIFFVKKSNFQNCMGIDTSKVKGCNGNYCMCLVRMVINYSNTNNQHQHEFLDRNLILLGTSSSIDDWSSNLCSDLTRSGFNVKLLQCKSMKNLDCIHTINELVPYVNVSATLHTFLWMQTSVKFDSVTFYREFGDTQYLLISFSKLPSMYLYPDDIQHIYKERSG